MLLHVAGIKEAKVTGTNDALTKTICLSQDVPFPSGNKLKLPLELFSSVLPTQSKPPVKTRNEKNWIKWSEVTYKYTIMTYSISVESKQNRGSMKLAQRILRINGHGFFNRHQRSAWFLHGVLDLGTGWESLEFELRWELRTRFESKQS